MKPEWETFMQDFNAIRDELQEARAKRAHLQEELDRASAQLHRVYARYLDMDERMFQLDQTEAEVTIDLCGKILSVKPKC
jgi:predicted nuclease with TOPRIM domain